MICVESFLLLTALAIQCRWLPTGVQCCTDPIVSQLTNPIMHAEGPHWDPETQSLYYVDVVEGLINKYDPSNNQVTSAELEGSSTPTIVIPVNGTKAKEFIVSSGHDILHVKWNHNNVTLDATTNNENVSVITSVETDEEHEGNHWNDGKADVRGRLWAGTVGPQPMPGKFIVNRAAFYRLDTNSNQAIVEERPVTNSNGLAWNEDNTLLYYIDSWNNNVDVFDFHLGNGMISNRRKVFSLPNNITESLDGMTVDSRGNLWIAIYQGGKVINVDPSTGALIRTVEIPAKQVTSLTFGGPNLDTLYVTTGRAGLSKEELEQQPFAGSVLSVSCLGVKALAPANNVVLTKTIQLQ